MISSLSLAPLTISSSRVLLVCPLFSQATTSVLPHPPLMSKNNPTPNYAFVLKSKHDFPTLPSSLSRTPPPANGTLASHLCASNEPSPSNPPPTSK